MKIEVFFDPVFHIVMSNMFSKKNNSNIISEAFSLKKKFVRGTIGYGYKKEFRSNTVAYYDNIYSGVRYKSHLLNNLDILFKNKKICEMLQSSPHPINLFGSTNRHETQVSRYGNKGQRYNWHVDGYSNNSTRILTFIYYFNKTPKKFSDGKLEITNSPIVDGKTIVNNPLIKTIVPENNMGIFFDSYVPHRVSPTISPKKFENGRFSVNCWVGYNE